MQQIPAKTESGFLRLTNEQAQYILDHISDYICLHDLEGRITGVNLPWQKKYAFASIDQVLNKPITDLMADTYKPLFADYLKRVLATGYDKGILALKTPDNQQQVIEYQSFLIYGKDGYPQEVAALAQDITHRVQAEKGLRESEKRYRNILDNIQEGYYEVDLTGRMIFFNPSLCVILGYSKGEMAAMTYKDYEDQSYADIIFKVFNQVFQTRKTAKAFDWKLIRKDGSTCYVETSISLITNEDGTPTGFRGIVRDISERIDSEQKKAYLENKLRQVQKMEALGMMARGFTHNFNNILFPLMGYIEMALLELPEKTGLREKLEKALESANRAKNILRKIHDFARDEDKLKPEPIDIASVVNETFELLRATFPKRIEMVRNIGDNCGIVMADPNQIRQVVINLCTNALDAMGEQNSGTITVTLGQTTIDGFTESPAHLSPGKYVHLSVSDTGCGIDPSISDKIFDPFFSTAPAKKTGLGLTVSASFVRKTGGDITVENNGGQGAAFHVYLPVADDAVARMTPGT